MNKTIAVKRIYEEVCTYYGWDEDVDEVDVDSKISLLRKKFNYLINNILFQNREDFKERGRVNVPLTDAPVIRELLIKAVSEDKKDELFVDWFNGKIKSTDYMKIYMLRPTVYLLINRLFRKGEIGGVTADEWISAIDASLNYDSAISSMRIQSEIAKFCTHAIALNHNIGFGDIVVQTDLGEKFYASIGKTMTIDVETTPLGEVIRSATSQNDYMNILLLTLTLLEEDAKKKGIEYIEFWAHYKESCNYTVATEALEQVGSMASEYVSWFQRVYEFLSNDPLLCQKIEEETNSKNLLEFFKMKDREA